MLSKSQAKAFFLIGTGLCVVAFLGLTLDTFKRIPAQTKAQNLAEDVIRGKHIFEKNNCMGCHTILGEGAYYAPELTKVFERRGEVFIKTILKDPEAMFPGERKMVNYHFSESEINDLTAFFKWVGEMDLNGFPAKPDLAPTNNFSKESSGSLPAQPQVFSQLCVACHAVHGAGGIVGPNLDDVGSKRDKDYIVKWLRNPMDIKPDSKMPKLPLTEAQIDELATFLSQLKGK